MGYGTLLQLARIGQIEHVKKMGQTIYSKRIPRQLAREE